ncbi:MAG: hypothetical protein R6V53_00260 [Candidatus Woesearchaeota archaeon]
MRLDETETMGEEMKLTLELLRDSMRQNQELIAMLREENKELKEELRALKTQKPQGLQKEVMRKFKRKQKDIIKGKIIEIAQGRDLRIAELKEMIVDDHEYCSKATFYRYIQELISAGMIQQAGEIIITQ